MKPALPPYLVLTGPSAAGKSTIALLLAQRFAIEIVSVDSALVYRGMDIGTAKPSATELASVPHHLINIRDPLHSYSAAQFVLDASCLIRDIHARGKWPLLVGGTMLYLHALERGLDPMPAANAVLRSQIEQEAKQHGWPALHAKLAQVDPISAARLASTDAQRISRALEVWRSCGQPLSSFHSQQPSAKSDTANCLLVSLEPSQRSWLHQRIAQRFDVMLQNGLLDEVQALRARGDLHPDLPSMRCVGYRQAWQALQENWPPDELRDKGIAATRQLAKRQITWLRSMRQRQVLACDDKAAATQLIKLVDGFLSQQATQH